MQAKQRCLILAAGFGTRMGPIGKTLPKVMWPVYEQSLLELQVRFARRLGYYDIYINLHHQADEILRRTESVEAFKGVVWLREKPEILDIGGGIHNLAARPEVNYQGELLVLNADQFLWFTKDELENWKHNAGHFDGLLLTWGVNTSQGYNEVTTDNAGRFLGVTPNAQLPRDKAMETYSGNSVINLSTLERKTGPSAFFDSVCPPTRKIMTARLREGRYWDFGTAQRYNNSIRGILELMMKNAPDDFVQFLVQEKAFLTSKMNASTKSYGCSVNSVINLGKASVPANHPEGIILAGEAVGSGTAAVLVYEGEVQPLS